jgi:DNA-binding HxlR family transcriptional regulator
MPIQPLKELMQSGWLVGDKKDYNEIPTSVKYSFTKLVNSFMPELL